jgi:hypothetical protein
MSPNYSRAARELRAGAAERRAQLSMGIVSLPTSTTQPREVDGTSSPEETLASGDESDFEIVPEDDAARRERLLAGNHKGRQESLIFGMESNKGNKNDVHSSYSVPERSTDFPRPRYTMAASHVQQEINDRQKESLGLDSRRTLGAAPASCRAPDPGQCEDDSEQWVCSVCTL